MRHAAGAERSAAFATYCKNLGVEYLTVYAFSTENWKRSADEVQAIMALFEKYLHEAIDEMERDHIRLKILGELRPISPTLCARSLPHGRNFHALSGLSGQYLHELRRPGRDCPRRAAHAADCVNGLKTPEELTEADFAHYLYTDGIPDPELIIRPSGEIRVELPALAVGVCRYYFTDVLWPDFDETELDRQSRQLSKRERRFGGK